MRTMYDSTNGNALPVDAQLAGCYVDGRYCTDAYASARTVRARCPNAIIVPIAVFASTNDGTVLDIEQGDATPAQAPGWVLMRREAGVDPSVYCNASTWTDVVDAFDTSGVEHPYYWIAHYDGLATIPDGAVAKQYNDPPGSGGDWDISAVVDYWPGIDAPPDPPPPPHDGGMMRIIGSPARFNTQAITDGFFKRNLTANEAAVSQTTFPAFPVDDTTWDALEANTNAMIDSMGQTPAYLSALLMNATSAVYVDHTGTTVTTANKLQAAIAALAATGGTTSVTALAQALAGPLATDLAPLLPPGVTASQLLHAMGSALTAAP